MPDTGSGSAGAGNGRTKFNLLVEASAEPDTGSGSAGAGNSPFPPKGTVFEKSGAIRACSGNCRDEETMT
ncbi:MAG TPA: hypothetical protein DCW71_00630 [Alistipes sp.]|nr:hypothetical protein [Alistipes sp.]